MLLRGDPWELVVRPQRGGRITSLRLDGEELLEQGIGIDDPLAVGFVSGGAFGWDEMVPTVDATDSLPDHGEAWRMPWQVGAKTRRSVFMRCLWRVVPWELGRRIELEEGRGRMSYPYTNRGTLPQYAYWCAHPLFKFERGMEIGVPDGARLARLADGTSEKGFLPAGSVDRVRLAWRSGTAIELAWDAGVTPYVGGWVCNGDLGGNRQGARGRGAGGVCLPGPARPRRCCGAGRG